MKIKNPNIILNLLSLREVLSEESLNTLLIDEDTDDEYTVANILDMLEEAIEY